MSVQSIEALHPKMKEVHKIHYLLTTCLNQDCLEYYFGRFCALAGDSQHPGPVQALQHMRILMVG